MLQHERHNQILAKLQEHGQVAVKELSQSFHVTEDCIRKDLAILQKAGQLQRIHGGAMLLRKNVHILHVDDRVSMHSPEKVAIAKKAVTLVKPGTTIFLDISTINIEIAKEIYKRDMDVTVVTNMIAIMQVFMAECRTRLVFIGGDFNQAKDGFIGASVIEQLHAYKFDIAFLGTVGIDVYNGLLTTYDMNDGLTKKEIMSVSKICYVVAESAKLELDGNYVYGHISDCTGYICETEIADTYKEKLSRYGLEIV